MSDSIPERSERDEESTQADVPSTAEQPELEGLEVEIKNLPPKTKERVLSVLMQKVHKGPMPDPDSVAKYAQVIPDGGNRMMVMAEKSLDHTIESNNKKLSIRQSEVQGLLDSISRGQTYGLVIGLVCIGCATWLAYMDKVVVASIIGGTTVVAMVVAFITGKRAQSENKDVQK